MIAALLALLLAAPRGNLVANPSFEADGGWSPVGAGFSIDETTARTGRRSLRCEGRDLGDTAGAVQVIELDPPLRRPFRIRAWSRAEAAEVAQDYSLYLDLHYADGKPLWGQIAPFEPGTHDWAPAELVFDVARPVAKIEAFLLFRKARGTVWFDDITVEPLPFEADPLRLLPGLFGPGSLAVTSRLSLSAPWRLSWRRPDSGAVTTGTGQRVAARWTGLRSPGTVRLEADDPDGGPPVVIEQRVVLPADAPARDYAVWTATAMERILPGALPPEPNAAPRLELSAAGGEQESGQIVLLPGPAPLRDVTVRLPDLRGPGGAVLTADRLSWRQVGFVKVESLRRYPGVIDAEPGWWPDPLLPVARFHVDAGVAQSLWLTVEVPPGQPAGRYAGEVTITPAGAPPTSVPLTVEVYGFDLPRVGHLKTAFALMDGFLERVYGRPLDPELRRRYGRFVMDHRLNPDDISRTDPPAIDDLLDYAPRGLNAFNVLNMVEPRGERPWVCWSPPEVYTPAFRQSLIDRLDPYVAELRRRDLARLGYVYTFDERGEEFYPILRDFFGLIKQRYPELPTLTTAMIPRDPAILRDLNVDWICPLTPGYDLAAADRCRAAGHQVWAYVCLGPGPPYANWLADCPLIEARVLWWQAYCQRLDGFLYWGLNIWDLPGNDRPIDPAAGPYLDWSISTTRGGGDYDWLHGDGRLLYAGPDGPIGSIRLAAIRDGLEDYEYLWLLAEQTGHAVARAAGEPVTTSLRSFTREPRVLLRAREAIARRIAAR